MQFEINEWLRNHPWPIATWFQRLIFGFFLSKKLWLISEKLPPCHLTREERAPCTPVPSGWAQALVCTPWGRENICIRPESIPGLPACSPSLYRAVPVIIIIYLLGSTALLLGSPQKLALTSPICGVRSVGIVSSRTQATPDIIPLQIYALKVVGI
jgi:hypothetical protein